MRASGSQWERLAVGCGPVCECVRSLALTCKENTNDAVAV